MREHHALRVAGAPRGVLHQAERFGIVERRQRRFVTLGRKGRDGLDAFQRLDLAAQQHRERAAFRHGDQHARAGIAQDHDLAAHVLFELRHAGGRIDRHRHGAGIENAEERGEEIRRGRQHHGDAIARHDVAADEALRHRARGGLQVAIAHRAEHGVLVLQHRDVDVIRMLRDVPVEHLGQGSGVIRLADQRRRGMHGDVRRMRRHAAGRGVLERLRQVGDRVHFGDFGHRQPHAEGALDAQHQFGARERVDAEVAVEAARQGHVAALQPLRRKLAHQLAHDGDQFGLA